MKPPEAEDTSIFITNFLAYLRAPGLLSSLRMFVCAFVFYGENWTFPDFSKIAEKYHACSNSSWNCLDQGNNSVQQHDLVLVHHGLFNTEKPPKQFCLDSVTRLKSIMELVKSGKQFCFDVITRFKSTMELFRSGKQFGPTASLGSRPSWPKWRT